MIRMAKGNSRAQPAPPDHSARRLLSEWKNGLPAMRVLAEVIASAFASGFSWGREAAGKKSTAPQQGIRMPTAISLRRPPEQRETTQCRSSGRPAPDRSRRFAVYSRGHQLSELDPQTRSIGAFMSFMTPESKAIEDESDVLQIRAQLSGRGLVLALLFCRVRAFELILLGQELFMCGVGRAVQQCQNMRLAFEPVRFEAVLAIGDQVMAGLLRVVMQVDRRDPALRPDGAAGPLDPGVVGPVNERLDAREGGELGLLLLDTLGFPVVDQLLGLVIVAGLIGVVDLLEDLGVGRVVALPPQGLNNNGRRRLGCG